MSDIIDGLKDAARHARGEIELPEKIVSAQYICEVPPELGRVTKLEIRNGKVLAHTESGTQMIVPTGD